ncbi:Ankrd28 [Symbiodinium sp. CCMP2592]|nr:Ankrd28 [Symbiodinium sp. CCMP2592]
MKRPSTHKNEKIRVQVYTGAGNLVADLHLHEATTIRKLKARLAPDLGVSRFRQKILRNTRLLDDDDAIRKSTHLQVVLLNYIPTSAKNIRQLIDASFEDSESEVEELLCKPQDVNASMPGGAKVNTANGATTALQAAASANNTDILKLLFQAHADVNRNGNDRALWHAAAQNAKEATRMLLQHRADPDATDQHGRSALLEAVAGGFHSLTQLVLEARADPNQRNDQGRTPFNVACHNNDEKMATTLLMARSDVHTRHGPRNEYDYETTALCACASTNCISGIKLLLGSSVHVDGQLNATALWYAAWHGRTEAVEFLLEQRADTEKHALHGGTPLCAAAFQGHDSILHKLIANLCDVESEEAVRLLQEPLQLAMWSDNPDTVKLLLDAKANASGVKNNTSVGRMHQLQLQLYQSTVEVRTPTLDRLRLYQYLQERQTQAQAATARRNLSGQEQEA